MPDGKSPPCGLSLTAHVSRCRSAPVDLGTLLDTHCSVRRGLRTEEPHALDGVVAKRQRHQVASHLQCTVGTPL